MNQRYVTKYGNWNGWWNNHQLVETVTVHSQSDAIQYLADRNSGHDLYYTTIGEPVSFVDNSDNHARLTLKRFIKRA